jgi:hypothetical protein
MRRAVPILTILLLAGVVGAQDLRGPTVRDKPAQPTLVERDFSGKLKRPEVPPEEAALALLNLDPGAKAKVDAVLAARAEVFDHVVLDNLDLVVRLHNARQAGDKMATVNLLTEFMRKLAPVNARGRLAEEIHNALPAEQAAKFDAIVAEYRTAAMAEARREAERRGERVAPRVLETRENLASIGAEIRRSYERQISARAAEFERIIAQLGLRAEQETKIRNMVTDYAQQTKGKATPEQRRTLFFRIMAELDQDQQKRLMALYLGHPDPG